MWSPQTAALFPVLCRGRSGLPTLPHFILVHAENEPGDINLILKCLNMRKKRWLFVLDDYPSALQKFYQLLNPSLLGRRRKDVHIICKKNKLVRKTCLILYLNIDLIFQ